MWSIFPAQPAELESDGAVQRIRSIVELENTAKEQLPGTESCSFAQDSTSIVESRRKEVFQPLLILH